MNLITINGVRGYIDENGTAQLNLEDVSRGLGFTQEKNGVEYVRWETIFDYLKSLKFSQQVGKEGYIPENIFYRLAMKAKNTVAEFFQEKVADEILPTIRKTGSYSIQQFQLPQSMPEALRMLATEMEDKQRIQTENLMLEQRVKEYEPKISYLDSILLSTDTVTITQIAKDYGLTGQALNKVLHEEKIQYNIGGQWLLYQKHQDKGFTRSQTIDVHHTDGHKTVKMNTKWTQKGRLFIHETLSKRGIVPYMDRDQTSKEA